ncbi:HEPN domain protein [Methanotorris formicicus Mc-S-70]|uniref:HEPN domain protein n=1 Tax=Methanotorris formicicus Mc-S-70 TaxID=647171 RepID=H1KZ51_9EURY|nr:HEPN domain protein [Methanotorris formicicus Mc-S-70]
MRLDDIDYLLNLAEEDLEEAEILFKNKKYKGAISRAYYAMFNSAKALLLIKDIHPKKHSGVLKMLGLEFINKGYLDEIYSKYYQEAFDMRHKVDYEPRFQVDEETAERIIEEASEFLNMAKIIINKFKELHK